MAAAMLAPVAAAQAAPTLGTGTYKADYGSALQSPYGPGAFGYLRISDPTLPGTRSGTFRIAAPGDRSLCRARAGLQSVIEATYPSEPVYVFALRDVKRVGKRTKRNSFCRATNNRLALYGFGYSTVQPAPDNRFLKLTMSPMQRASDIRESYGATLFAPVISSPPYVLPAG